ncbi:hypothetical protein GUJ93_ZPchr0014g46565 [Zizania palustris]|uniref:Uncharacterized protein n=1 Tax=Zizania palustris TaxID=103762 RepID=A0A8J5W5T2_ZIZPA|nr:hypothetical protein GUJ93_ZPchr0014g46565 [Zizania palustris]
MAWHQRPEVVYIRSDFIAYNCRVITGLLGKFMVMSIEKLVGKAEPKIQLFEAIYYLRFVEKAMAATGRMPAREHDRDVVG